jgi:hypothetical protein
MQEETTSLIDVVKLVLQFAVLPIGAFMWMHYKLTQAHDTEIAVMKSEYNLTKEGHDRELKEIKEGFKAVLSKLDEIQKDFRK